MIEKTIVRGTAWQINYFDSGGDGDLVILLHGFPDSPWSFFDLSDRLSRIGYRCIIPYLAGYHDSHDNWTSEIFIHDFVSDLYEIMLHEKRNNSILIGSDWGAQASVLFGALYPTLCEKLIVLGYSKANRSVYNSFDYQRGIFHLLLFQTDFLENLTPDELIEFLCNWVKDSAPGLSDDHSIFASIRKIFRSESVAKAAVQHYRTRFRHGESATLSKAEISSMFPLRMPVLAVHGNQDRPGRSEAFYSSGTDSILGPKAKKVMLKDCGHFPHLEQPEHCWQVLRGFINA